MEREYGSLVKAMLARMKQRRRERARTGAHAPSGTAPGSKAGAESRSSANTGGPAGPGGVITSFLTGMEEFIEALVSAVGERRIRLSAPVDEIVGEPDFGRGTPGGAGRARRAVVALNSGERIEADAVVVAAPSWAASPLFRRSDPDLVRPLDDIPFASIAVVATGHRREDIAHPLDGFGFLIPRGEGRRTLGTLWPASTFTGRAPEGFAILRTMIGGATDPDAVALDDAGLLGVVAREVYPVLGVRGEPVWTRIFRFPRGIAQYNVGHARKLERIEAALTGWSNLYLFGASYRGIAINSTCEHAPALADAALDALPVRASGERPSSRLF